MDGAFPGCGVAIHYVSGDADPLFQTDKFAATYDPAITRGLAARTIALGGMTERRWHRIRHLGFDGWAAIDSLTP